MKRDPAIGADGSPPWGAAICQGSSIMEHVTENHGVGGSIPPLGTIEKSLSFNMLMEICGPFFCIENLIGGTLGAQIL
jgi:hypothetical protein